MLLPYKPLQVHWSATGSVFLAICSVKKRKCNSGVHSRCHREKHPEGSERIKRQKVKDKGKDENALLQNDKMRSPWLLCKPHGVFFTCFEEMVLDSPYHHLYL